MVTGTRRPGCAPRTLPRRRGKHPQARPQPPGVRWDAVARAIALLTAEHLGTGDTREAILGELSPGPVLDALVLVSGGMLRAVLGTGQDEQAARDTLTTMLRLFGEIVLRESAR